MAVVLVVSVVGVAMAWLWSVDSFAAGQVADRLVRVGTALDPLPETVARPDSAWWKSTAANLMHWALYLDRAGAGKPGTDEEVESLLETASKSSPIEPQVRFAKTRPVTGVGREVTLFQGLGTSHDVLALTWSGHQLLASGKDEAALTAYREALEMASRAEVSRLGLPAFDDDPQVRRYALPHEALIGVVIRDMVSQDRWTSAEWTRALPDFAVAPLVAARVLRERGELDIAQKLLESLVTETAAPPSAGTSSAIHLAAQAEALAMKSRWNEADQRYRQAIRLMPVDAIRRSWWINVADIALRLNDEEKRQIALEAARGQDEGDEIARHALEMLKYTGPRSERPTP
jgi:tetratricopeptide (TPR) repeat protein